MNIVTSEQIIELGQVSVLTLGPYGSYIEGYHRFFDYYPYDN